MGRLIQRMFVVSLTLLSVQSFADDQDRALQLREAGKILSLGEILSMNSAWIDGHILEVELERERDILIYELEILDDKGRVWELKVDAKSGRIIKRELD